MRDLPNGITRQQHVEYSLQIAADAIRDVQQALSERLTKARREVLWRRLAGAVGHCESVRVWLERGAPR